MLARLHASPLQLAMGFAGATAFLSMWISNTAPNLVFLENMQIYAPESVPSFLEWMMIGVPMVVVGLVILFAVLGPQLSRLPWKASDGSALQQSLIELGRIRFEEKTVGWILTITALLWMSRKGLQTESFTIPGWAELLPYKGVDDGTVAILMASLLFLFRSKQHGPILNTASFRKLPWDIVLLLGGGFALAYGMQHSGLSGWIGGQLEFLGDVPLVLMMLGIACITIFLTSD